MLTATTLQQAVRAVVMAKIELSVLNQASLFVAASGMANQKAASKRVLPDLFCWPRIPGLAVQVQDVRLDPFLAFAATLSRHIPRSPRAVLGIF